MEYEPQSTQIYIKNMKHYSIAQIAIYLPYTSFLALAPYFSFPLDGNTYYNIDVFLTAIISLSGFVNVMLFISKGPLGFIQPKTASFISEDHI